MDHDMKLLRRAPCALLLGTLVFAAPIGAEVDASAHEAQMQKAQRSAALYGPGANSPPGGYGARPGDYGRQYEGSAPVRGAAGGDYRGSPFDARIPSWDWRAGVPGEPTRKRAPVGTPPLNAAYNRMPPPPVRCDAHSSDGANSATGHGCIHGGDHYPSTCTCGMPMGRGHMGPWMGPDHRSQPHGFAPHAGMGHHLDIHRLLAMPGLTDEQRDEIQRIYEELRKNHWELAGKRMELSVKLRGLYKADPLDVKAIGQAYGDIFDVKRQMIESALEAHRKIAALLTEEQKARVHGRGHFRPWNQPYPSRGPVNNP